jgi:hypothetical protein
MILDYKTTLDSERRNSGLDEDSKRVKFWLLIITKADLQTLTQTFNIFN